MSNLVVLTFNDTEQAGQVFEAVKQAQSNGQVNVEDAAVIVKDESGKVHLKNQLDKAIAIGAVGGGILGLMIASVFFPLAGLAFGAISGGLIGKSLDKGVDQKFVKDVTETLKPGSSALFVIGSGDSSVVMAILRPFQGTVYQTSLPPELVDGLLSALKNKE
jgi:uncharacterized membrane protein